MYFMMYINVFAYSSIVHVFYVCAYSTLFYDVYNVCAYSSIVHVFYDAYNVCAYSTCIL